MATSRDKQRIALTKVLLPVLSILIVIAGALYLIKSQFGHSGTPDEHAQIQVEGTLPDLQLTKLQGKTLLLSEINAKVMMVTFWATWCDACMDEMPSIIKLRNKYKNQGFEVLGVNLDENPETAALKVAKQLGIEFPIFKDPDGKIAELFDVRAIPFTIIIDHQRKILQIKDGEQDWNAPMVQSQLERWLSG